MLIFKYLFKEVFITLFALTVILMLIFMSNQIVQYITRVANGQIPIMFMMKLLMLEMPNLLGLLLPLGFYIAVLLAYGRLYVEREMLVLHASGYGVPLLLRDTLIMATGVACVVAAVVFFWSPEIARMRVQLLRTTGAQVFIKTVMPQRFQTLPQGGVFYVSQVNRAHDEAEDIFLARPVMDHERPSWQVLWSHRASIVHRNHDEVLQLHQGQMTWVDPGNAASRIASFEDLTLKLPAPVLVEKAEDMRTKTTQALWYAVHHHDHTLSAQVELAWRCAVPTMVFVLTFMAVLLSHVNPRSGQYAALFPAIFIFFIYANLLFMARDWMLHGQTPLMLGLWWVHLPWIILGIILFKKRRA